MRFKVLLLIIVLSLIIPLSYLEPTNSQNLDFDVVKTKYMDVNVSLQIPIYIDSYSDKSSFTLTTPVFINTKNQTTTLDAYYFEQGIKVPATFTDDEYGNRFAVFEISNINRNEYIFYVDGRIISENKIIFPESIFSLENKIEDFQEYTLPTRYINSDRSEIISTSNFIKKSDNALKEITNIIDWTYNYLEYDISYSDKVVEAVNVLAERKGVCSEFSILAAALLRERGIPTRYVTGYANSTVDWQSHAWLEAYVPELGWISLDPTFGEVGLVDASHLLISRSFDPSDVKDRITTYNKVSLRFGEKVADFKINSHKSFSDYGYSNSINVIFSHPTKVKEGSAFFMTAKLTNTTSRPISMLFMFGAHPDFKVIYPESKDKVVYLEPFKEEEISFFLIAENVFIPQNHFKSYSFNLKSQVGDTFTDIEFYKNDGYYQEAFFITPPIFYVDNDVLNLSFNVINYTSQTKNITLDFNNNGFLENQHLNVSPNRILNFKKNFIVSKESRFTLDFSQDYTSSHSYYIFDDYKVLSEQEYYPEEVDSKDALENVSILKPDVNEAFSINENKSNSFLTPLIIILLFVFLTVVVYFSTHKRDVS